MIIKIKWFSIIFILTSNIIFAGDALNSSIDIAASALNAQSKRLEIISENLANAHSTGTLPGEEPYRRKTIYFEAKKNGLGLVKIKKFGHDYSEFTKKYDPSHPASDAEGYVLLPNVDPIIESADSREAERSYNANLRTIEISRSMISKTLEILR